MAGSMAGFRVQQGLKTYFPPNSGNFGGILILDLRITYGQLGRSSLDQIQFFVAIQGLQTS